MLRDVRGKPVEGRFDQVVVRDGCRTGTDAQEPGGTLSVVGEQAVDIGAEHAPVRRTGTFVHAPGKPRERPRAVRTVGDAHMHLIAFERRSVGRRTEGRREPLLAGEYSLHAEQAQTLDL